MSALKRIQHNGFWNNGAGAVTVAIAIREGEAALRGRPSQLNQSIEDAELHLQLDAVYQWLVTCLKIIKIGKLQRKHTDVEDDDDNVDEDKVAQYPAGTSFAADVPRDTQQLDRLPHIQP